ncbi:MAG: CHAT domain-containing protein, partial [Pseudomonadota bacterium]
MCWFRHVALAAFIMLGGLCLANLAVADQHSVQTDPLQLGIRELRQSADTNDAARFIATLDRVVPMVFDEPRLAVQEKLGLLAGFAALTDRLTAPEARIEAESWFLVYAEVALGKEHEITVGARGRLVMQFLQMGRQGEAEALAADGPTAPGGQTVFNSLMATRLIEEGRYDEAIRILLAEIDDDKRRTPGETPERDMVIMMLGRAYLDAGAPEDAVAVLEPLYHRRVAAGHSPEIALIMALYFGQALSGTGRHAQAKKVMDDAHSEAETRLGPTHRTSLMIGLVRSNVYGDAGEIRRYEELRLCHYGLSRQANLVPLELAITLENHAEFLKRLAYQTEEAGILRELIALVDRSPELDPLVGIRARKSLAENLLVTEPSGPGRAHLIEAVRGFERLLGPDNLESLRAKALLTMLDTRTRPISDADIATMRRLARAEGAHASEVTIEAIAARANLAQFLNDTGRYQDALSEVDGAIVDLDRAPSPEFQLASVSTTRSIRAQALRGLGRVDEAVIALEKAVEAVINDRRSLQTIFAGDLPFATNVAGDVGWQYADAAWDAARDAAPDRQVALRAQAFETVQIAGFGDAAQALTQAETRRLQQDPDAAEALAAWEVASIRARDQRARLVNDPSATTQAPALDSAEAALKAALPDYFDRLVPDPLGWDDVRGQDDLLSDQEALVLIVPAPLTAENADNPYGFVFAASRDKIAWARIPLTPIELARSIARAHAQLDRRALPGLDYAARAPVNPDQRLDGTNTELFDIDTAHALYRVLFGAPEIAAILEDKDHWILVPQRGAMSLPYASLVMSLPPAIPKDGRDLRAVRWLGLEKALTILPSAAALRQRAARDPAVSPTGPAEGLAYIGFGDPAFSGLETAALRTVDEIHGEGVDRARAVGRLPRLPGTRREVRALSDLLGASETYLGAAASERTFEDLARSGRLDGLKILHFATHGLLAGNFNALKEPALALSPPVAGAVAARAEGFDDGLLTASEIARIRLAVEWVILSACDTSGSADPRASLDGLSGLVRA